jgi:TatD DNase family protein
MTYSVWLRLAGDAERVIQSAIVKTALRFGTPVFPAHLTLATEFKSVEEASEFARAFVVPPHLNILPAPYVVTENTRWQTTVVLRVSDISINNLSYPPHISLVYHVDESLRSALATELSEHLFKLGDIVQVGPVEVWKTDGHFDSIPFWFQVSATPRYFDVAVNLTDGMFEGVYHKKSIHENDRTSVIKRAIERGCDRMVLLGCSVEDSISQLELARGSDERHLFTTVGVHPTRTSDFVGDRDLPKLRKIISDNLDRVVALGEVGLDADRVHFASMEKQREAFNAQLCLAAEFKLPLLLHFRGSACFDEFTKILKNNREAFTDGVVHSFTGTRAEMETIVNELGLAIGVNGCSLRDESFLSDVLPFIPMDKLVFGTDAPYCDIRPTHPTHKYLKKSDNFTVVSKPEKWAPGCLVKGRNEPCRIEQVAEVVSQLYPAREAVLEAAYANARRIFPRSA